MTLRVFIGALATAGLAAAALMPAAQASGGSGCRQPNQRQEVGTEVRIDETGCFAPLVLRTDPGTRVYFRNDGHAPHNVIGQGWSSWVSFSDGIVAPGQRFSYTFREAGYYPFACSLHPDMVGVVIVGEPDGGAVVTTQSAAGGSRADGLDPGDLALLGAAGLVALGMIGGGAFLRFGRRR